MDLVCKKDSIRVNLDLAKVGPHEGNYTSVERKLAVVAGFVG